MWVAVIANSSVTTSASVAGTGTPIIEPTPASPENSVSNAPMQESTSVPTETHAQIGPNRSLMHCAWPLPVTTPSRTVSSWTR